MGVKEDLEVAARLAHVRLLSTLAQKIEPAHTALLVIDMQNDFCAPGGCVSKGGADLIEAQTMAKRLPVLIAGARAAGVRIVFVHAVFSTEQNFYLSDAWLEHAGRARAGSYTRVPVCAEGAWGGDHYEDIRPQPGDAVVTKHRYDAFQGTDLDLILRSNGIRTVILTGVVTHVCVESSARSAFMHDYYVVVVGDGTAAYAVEDHAQSLKNIDRFFGEVSTIEQLCAIWREQSRARAAAE
jgi:ureidoacrylate peracid hydrolase